MGKRVHQLQLNLYSVIYMYEIVKGYLEHLLKTKLQLLKTCYQAVLDMIWFAYC